MIIQQLVVVTQILFYTLKIKKEAIKDIIIIIFSMFFVGLSFADFYIITTTGSVIDDITGGFAQHTKATRNSLFSVVCVLFPLISFIIKKSWTRIMAILVSILNFLIITMIQPTLVSATSLIGASYSANLTNIGWLGTILVLLIIFLFFSKEDYLKKMCRKKGGKEE